MNHKQLPINSAGIRIYINNDGQVEGELAWNCADTLEQEYVDALVEAIHGLMALVTTEFDEVRAAGRIFQKGQETEMESRDMIFEPDFEEEVEQGKNVVSFNTSNRKH